MSSFWFFLLEMVNDEGLASNDLSKMDNLFSIAALRNSSLNSLAVLPVLGLLKPKH